MVIARPPIRRRDGEERIILMKSGDRSEIMFILIFISSRKSINSSNRRCRHDKENGNDDNQ